MHKFLLSLMAFLALPAAAQNAAERIEVQNPYVRLAPPGSLATGAFMVLKNVGEKEVGLVQVESTVAKSTELHNHVSDNGVMKMRPVAVAKIAPKSELALKPGGYHVMLIDLKSPLGEGDRVTIGLKFEDGSSKTVEAKVVREMPGMMSGQHKH